MDKGKKTATFGLLAGVLFVGLAVFCDWVGLIPILKDFLATIFWGLVSGYAWLRGMKIFSGKKLATMVTSWLISVIPFLQELPIELTAGIVAMIALTWFESKAASVPLVKPMLGGKASTLPRSLKAPRTQGGVGRPRTKEEREERENMEEEDFSTEDEDMDMAA
jgi:hypothetical protein